MGVGWPKEYGGHGLGEIEQTIFANEAQYSDVHLPAVTLQTVGPTLIRYGTEKQKDLFLARILAGDVHFAIGYSEPTPHRPRVPADDRQARRRPLRRQRPEDVDHRRPPGRLRVARGPHRPGRPQAQGHLDPDRRHQGPGLLVHAIITADGPTTSTPPTTTTSRVPVDMLVGEENQGWKLITTQLNHERVMLGPGRPDRGAARPGRRLGQPRPGWSTSPTYAACSPARRRRWFRVNELLNWEVARAAAVGEISVGDASSSKVFAADQVQHLLADLTAIVHRYGDPSDEETRQLMHYFDGQKKRNLC